MIVLALDTTTRAGSIALMRDGALAEVFVGDASRTHATRLPGDLIDCLERHHLTLADVALYAVAAGPGSFTGLRIGIATIQGLAFANRKQVVAVSVLEALALAATEAGQQPVPALIGSWMDAQRHEIYAQLWRPLERTSRTAAGADLQGRPNGADTADLEAVGPAAVGEPGTIVRSWLPALDGDLARPFVLVGDGALAYQEMARSAFPGVAILDPVPPAAPAIALLAERRARSGLATAPHAIRPIYVRRPDAELARDRRAGERQTAPAVPGEGARRT